MDSAIARQLADTGADAGFWAGLDAGQFRLPQCPECQRWIWPADWSCGTCGSFGLQWTAVALGGTVYSWTRTWYPFASQRAESLPYVVVLVEFEHAGGTRMLGVLTGDQLGLQRDAPVVGRIERPSDQTYGLPSVTWSLLDAPAGLP
jgi:uncharacterized OB-fold protein